MTDSPAPSGWCEHRWPPMDIHRGYTGKPARYSPQPEYNFLPQFSTKIRQKIPHLYVLKF